MKIIHGEKVYGSLVDAQTRCAHYRGAADIIALKFKCCGDWFPCFECHAESVSHPATVWTSAERETPAILCGGCGHQLKIAEYLAADSICPHCRRQFNPRCAAHYHLYFEV